MNTLALLFFSVVVSPILDYYVFETYKKIPVLKKRVAVSFLMAFALNLLLLRMYEISVQNIVVLHIGLPIWWVITIYWKIYEKS